MQKDKDSSSQSFNQAHYHRDYRVVYPDGVSHNNGKATTLQKRDVAMGTLS